MPIKDSLDAQHEDNAERRYAYDFDYKMHSFMLRTWGPWWHNERVLEMGCYRGQFTKRLCDLFAHVTVIEGSADLVAEARKAAPRAHFWCGRFEDAAMNADAAFDHIFLIHALEHVDDPDLILRRIRTWLAPKGRLYVAVPNAFAASRQIATTMGLLPHPWAVMDGERAQGHKRTYDLTYLQRTVTDAGLRIVDSGGILFKPLSNHQFDLAMGYGLVDDGYLEGCYQLGKLYPELCASIYAVCES